MKPAKNPSGHILPDVLARDLKIIFCGSAASSISAREKAYYAGTGNKFWTTIFDIGLTPRVLIPQDYFMLLDFGVGLTDIAKRFTEVINRFQRKLTTLNAFIN